MEKINIAIVGLGPAGLTALKNLREEGFNAIAFERRDRVGGLWSFSDNISFTCALDDTVTNISKFVSSLSDFPIPKDYPVYLTGSLAAKYFESYASHFKLRDFIRFNTIVRRVIRNTSDNGWDVHITNSDGESVLSFDKVVFAHGCEHAPVFPPMSNRHMFKGTVIHSQAYKRPEPFKDKRVLVVGIGNTACEISIALRGDTTKLYQSYRQGRIMLSRYRDGIPFDIQIPWPILSLKYFLDYKIPWLTEPLVDKVMINKMINDTARFEPTTAGSSYREKLRRAERRLREDWHLLPCPSMSCANPAVQEDFISALYQEDIIPVQGFKDFIGEHQVLLSDETVIEVDAVIFCTGYENDFSIMPDLEIDGACGLPLKNAEGVSDEQRTGEQNTPDEGKRNVPHIPRLFQMIFPPRWASSVAFLSWVTPQESVWCISELESIAVSQIWAAETAKSMGLQPQTDGYRPPAFLPSIEEMNAQVDAYHTWWRNKWEKDNSMRPGSPRGYPFLRFLHNAAGTGLYENLDHMLTGRAWALWWNNRELWTWLAKGPMNSYSWRLFETNPKGFPGCGRRTWPGAREALKETYEEAEHYKKEARKRSRDGEST
ncbi:FAD/NAD(P)-binding domain-containing protein [Xylariaceae sp. FL0662B]|nr:FAD/NAD(P)-binding domain-containing protein [Xylariaceae sp. FL0662B]